MRSIASSWNVTWSWRISATFLRIMVVELPESAAHVATDPNRVYYVGAGYNPYLLPGLLFLTRPCLRQRLRDCNHDMLDGLRQGLVRNLLGLRSCRSQCRTEICTVFRNFTGTPFNVAAWYCHFRAAASASLS